MRLKVSAGQLALVIAIICAPGFPGVLASELSRGSAPSPWAFSTTQVRLTVLGYLQLVFGRCEPSIADLKVFEGLESELEARFSGGIRAETKKVSARAKETPSKTPRAPEVLGEGERSVSLYVLWLRERFALDLRRIQIDRIETPAGVEGAFRVYVHSARPDHDLILGHTPTTTLVETGWIWIESVDGKQLESLMDTSALQRFARGHESDVGRAPRCK